MSKPFFRPTDASFKKSMGVISGSKSAGSKIQDLEDDEEIITEVDGYVERINMSQIQGNGWICRGKTDKKKYNCSISSELYTVPEGIEKKGYLYPKSEMAVVISVNPVKRKYVITEISGGFSSISNWTKSDTITMANKDSAVQVSSDSSKIATKTDDGENGVEVTKDGVNIYGEVMVNGEDIKDILNTTIQSYLEDENTPTIYNKCNNGIMIEKVSNIANMTLSDTQAYLTKAGKILCHIYNESLWPSTSKSFIALTDKAINLDAIKITSTGDIIAYTAGDDGDRIINTSITWITDLADKKNVVEFTGTPSCTCSCKTDYEEPFSTEAIDYCTMCKTFGHMVQDGNVLKCEACESKFCGVCGRYLKEVCGNTTRQLKSLTHTITSNGDKTCECCNGETVKKTYVNYCPKCKEWDVLKTNIKNKKQEIKCSKCSTTFCGFCGSVNTNADTCKDHNTRLLFITRTT